MAPRIYADFNGLMGSPGNPSRSCVPLDTWGSLRDLSNAGIMLRDGLVLVICDWSDELEDLEADAIAHFDRDHGWWYAELVGEYRYVPARDRSAVTTFLCVGCRADLGPDALEPDATIVKRYDSCPKCGRSIRAAITPP